MASLRPLPLPLGFMLFVLCFHHCSARKVLMDDLKREAAQLHVDDKSPSIESDPLDPGIGLECGSLGCQTGGIPCLQEPCSPGYEIIPQPPHIFYPQPIIEPTPPVVFPITKPPCTTPCEPWYGPGPCPCEPCEEGAVDKEGVKTESNNSAKQADELI